MRAAAIILFAAAMAGGAASAGPVEDIHDRLGRPFTTNDAFVSCLGPIDRAGAAAFDDAARLDPLSTDLNRRSLDLGARIDARHRPATRARRKRRLNAELGP